MAEQDIHEFREPYIAVYRPNKKTYAILNWEPVGRFWKRYAVDQTLLPNVTLRTQNIPEAPSRINYISYNTEGNRCIRCIGTGEYLVYGMHYIAVLRKVPSSPSFPLTIFMHEFPCTARSEPPVPIPPLWTLRTHAILPVPAPLPALPQITPLPMRIAWIIAEDASAKGETCSITLEQISPITASVTTCFHCFETNAINTWLETHSSCPLCKQATRATPAMEDKGSIEEEA
jgi:hypothetical protein